MKKSTDYLKEGSIDRKWHVIDAQDKILGRIASKAAVLLMGKEKTTFTPHIDNGDFVIIVNAAKFIVTGKKMTDKKYYRHSGYPGGLKERSLREMLEKKPEDIIRLAVKRMLPKNKMSSRRIIRLKIYLNSEHNHTAQKPINVTICEKNEKEIV